MNLIEQIKVNDTSIDGYQGTYYDENPEYVQVTTDAEGKIIEGIKSDGSKHITGDLIVDGSIYNDSLNVDVEQIVEDIEERVDEMLEPVEDALSYFESADSSEWLQVDIDNERKICGGRDKNGRIREYIGIDTSEIKSNTILTNSVETNTIEIKEEIILSIEAKEKLENELSLDNSLPSYYFENDYIINKVKTINDFWANSGANADLFLFFTDAHYYANYLKTEPLMQYVLKNSCIRKVFYGGDTAHNKGLDTVSDIAWENKIAKTIALNCKYFPVRGNHDYYNDNKLFPYTAVRNNLFSLCNVENIVVNDANQSIYYYYDEAFSKTRYVIIDIFDAEGINYIAPMTVRSRQFAFLADAFNNTPNDYSIVVFGHSSPENGTIHEDIEYERATSLRRFIAAYQNRETVTIDSNTYDFTDALSNIVMYIGGHSHEDMQNYVNGTLYVSVPCDSYNRNRTASMYTYHEYPPVINNSINELCFEACIFDRSNNVVNFERIGWGFNRRFNLNRFDLHVGETQQLTSVFDTVSQWLIHDSQGATYDNTLPRTTEWWSFTNNIAQISTMGIVTALTAGECYAIAIAENGDKEFFYIKVLVN